MHIYKESCSHVLVEASLFSHFAHSPPMDEGVNASIHGSADPKKPTDFHVQLETAAMFTFSRSLERTELQNQQTPHKNSHLLHLPSFPTFPPLFFFPSSFSQGSYYPSVRHPQHLAGRAGCRDEGAERNMELNGEIGRCHRCTFSICRPLPSLPLSLYIQQPSFIPSIHFADGSAGD